MSLTVPLTVTVTTARTQRRVTRDVRDLTFRSVAPGGFAAATVALDRPLLVQPDDVDHYGLLTIHDARTGLVAWEGRLEDPSLGAGRDGTVWDLVAVGPSGHARDRTVPLIYVDQSLSDWRRVDNVTPGGTDAVADDPGGSGQWAIVLQFPQGLGVTTNSRVVMMYQQIWYAGQKLARVSYRTDAGLTDAAFAIDAYARRDGVAPADLIHSGGWSASGTTISGVVGTNWSVGRNTVDLRIRRTGGALTIPDDRYWASIREIKIRAMLLDELGRDVTSYTTDTVLAHEVVRDLLGRLLPQYDPATATIATTSTAIDKLAYPDGVTPAQVLDDLMRIEPAYFWAAWEAVRIGARVVIEDFEDNSFQVPITGTWARSSLWSYAGTWSYKSATIGTNATSDASITVPPWAVDLIVRWRISSSANDAIQIFADEALVMQRFGQGATAVTGEVTIDVSTATRVVVRYMRGVAADQGDVAAFVDQIEFRGAAAGAQHRFEWVPWPTVVRYEADVTAGYVSTGSAAQLYNAVRVRYRDAQTQDIRSVRRVRSSPILRRAGLVREQLLDLGDDAGSTANAEAAGDGYLADHAEVQAAGRLTVAGPIPDLVEGRLVQPWEIRPGRLIRVRGIVPRPAALTATARDGVSVFRIIGTEYRASSNSVVLDLDSYSPTVARALAKVVDQSPTRRR